MLFLREGSTTLARSGSQLLVHTGNVAKYLTVFLGTVILVYGYLLNSTSCLIGYLQGPLPYSCPVILWPYVLGATTILLGVFSLILPHLTSSHKVKGEALQ
jgi:hypothetical protein